MTAVNARDVILAPLEPAGTVERLVRRLGEAIGAGLLAQGERLPPEPELAAQLQVSPMTLRQALAVLRDEGVLETRRGRHGGSFVRRAVPEGPAGEPPTRQQVRELTDWRRAISGESAALAAERGDERALAALADAAAATERAVADVRAFRLADARFHVAVAEAARARRLVAAEAAIQTELATVLRFTPGPERARAVSQAGHHPILAAIAARDPAAARAAMEAHVEGTHDWVIGLRLGRLG
jgi:GntR family transcriptional regulator, transcriptional repressor for pyruvate dehydrogenase complex